MAEECGSARLQGHREVGFWAAVLGSRAGHGGRREAEDRPGGYAWEKRVPRAAQSVWEGQPGVGGLLRGLAGMGSGGGGAPRSEVAAVLNRASAWSLVLLPLVPMRIPRAGAIVTELSPWDSPAGCPQDGGLLLGPRNKKDLGTKRTWTGGQVATTRSRCQPAAAGREGASGALWREETSPGRGAASSSGAAGRECACLQLCLCTTRAGAAVCVCVHSGLYLRAQMRRRVQMWLCAWCASVLRCVRMECACVSVCSRGCRSLPAEASMHTAASRARPCGVCGELSGLAVHACKVQERLRSLRCGPGGLPGGGGQS